MTAQQAQAGALQAWLEATYQWYTSLNPCPTTPPAEVILEETKAIITKTITESVTQAATEIESA